MVILKNQKETDNERERDLEKRGNKKKETQKSKNYDFFTVTFIFEELEKMTARLLT